MMDKVHNIKEEKLQNDAAQELSSGDISSQEKFRKWFADFQADFSPGFEQKLMQRLSRELTAKSWDVFPVFRTFALSGVAAVILILIGVYFTNGSLNIDSLLGINGYAPDLGLLSFL